MNNKARSPKEDGGSRTESSSIDAQEKNLRHQWSRYEMNECRQKTRRQRGSRMQHMNNAIKYCEVISAPAQSIETRGSLIFKNSRNHTCNPGAVCGNFWKTNSKDRAGRFMRSPGSIRMNESRK